MSKKQGRLKKITQLMNTLHDNTNDKGELKLTKRNTSVVIKHVESMLNDDGVFVLKDGYEDKCRRMSVIMSRLLYGEDLKTEELESKAIESGIAVKKSNRK